MTNDYYDLTVLSRMTGGDKAFLKHMVQLFLTEAPKQVEEMRVAIENQDWTELGKTAHKIKSTIKSMGIHSMVDDALSLEQDGKNQTNLGMIEENFALFEAKFIQVVELLQQEDL